MKPKNTLEKVLRQYYQAQKQAIPPEEALDRKVLAQMFAKQDEIILSSRKHGRGRLAGAVAAAAAILLAAFVILEKRAPQAEPLPQKEVAIKPVSPPAVSRAGLPTLFRVNMVLREKGLEEACRMMTYSPENNSRRSSRRSLPAGRMESVTNGS